MNVSWRLFLKLWSFEKTICVHCCMCGWSYKWCLNATMQQQILPQRAETMQLPRMPLFHYLCFIIFLNVHCTHLCKEIVLQSQLFLGPPKMWQEFANNLVGMVGFFPNDSVLFAIIRKHTRQNTPFFWRYFDDKNIAVTCIFYVVNIVIYVHTLRCSSFGACVECRK